jgi:formylglycine-generating enzyme required for sulfatase activity
LLSVLNHADDYGKASDGDHHRVAHGKEAPHPQSRLWAKLAVAAVAIVFGGFAVLHFLAPDPPVPKQSAIRAGQYIVGGGKRVNLASFTIDSTEVSNLQYSKFIDWLRAHPNEASRFDHPEQPSHYSHISPEWNEMFPEKKLTEKRETDPRWRLPVTQVSGWDAYAFAAWTGRVLPTEEQWEAAGRGTRGFLFPWGDEPEPERSNVARADFKRTKGEINALMAVNELKDTSAAGVSGLSGNVSEWTATRENRKLVAKGGHFDAPLLTLDSRSIIAPDTRSPHLGFRTVSPPEPANP